MWRTFVAKHKQQIALLQLICTSGHLDNIQTAVDSSCLDTKRTYCNLDSAQTQQSQNTTKKGVTPKNTITQVKTE